MNCRIHNRKEQRRSGAPVELATQRRPAHGVCLREAGSGVAREAAAPIFTLLGVRLAPNRKIGARARYSIPHSLCLLI